MATEQQTIKNKLERLEYKLKQLEIHGMNNMNNESDNIMRSIYTNKINEYKKTLNINNKQDIQAGGTYGNDILSRVADNCNKLELAVDNYIIKHMNATQTQAIKITAEIIKKIHETKMTELKNPIELKYGDIKYSSTYSSYFTLNEFNIKFVIESIVDDSTVTNDTASTIITHVLEDCAILGFDLTNTESLLRKINKITNKLDTVMAALSAYNLKNNDHKINRNNILYALKAEQLFEKQKIEYLLMRELQKCLGTITIQHFTDVATSDINAIIPEIIKQYAEKNTPYKTEIANLTARSRKKEKGAPTNTNIFDDIKNDVEQFIVEYNTKIKNDNEAIKNHNNLFYENIVDDFNKNLINGNYVYDTEHPLLPPTQPT